MHSRSFPPIATAQSRVLILGSMPGVKSLEKEEYYAHPQNQFWPILGRVFDMPVDSYARRVQLIKDNKLALWDVLECCYREGSLDSSIKNDSIVVNDFSGFFAQHPKIRHVFFDSGKAEAEYKKRVLPLLPEKFSDIQYHRLPSPSPAMAGMSLVKKIKAWAKIKKALE